MKKVVWGGFCLIAGILTFWMFCAISFSLDHGVIDFLLNSILKMLAITLGVYGLIAGFNGLKKD